MPFKAYLYIYVCIYTYMCIHTHTQTHTRACARWGGRRLKFLPVSQSEAPTETPALLYFGGEGSCLMASVWPILKGQLHPFQGHLCAEMKGWAGLFYGAPDERGPVGLSLPPFCCQPAICNVRLLSLASLGRTLGTSGASLCWIQWVLRIHRYGVSQDLSFLSHSLP